MRLTWDPTNHLSISGMDFRILRSGASRYLWAKGYFFDETGRMWYGPEITEWLVNHLTGSSLVDLAPRMNGCFAIVVVSPQSGRVEVVVDRYATVPLFVHTDTTSLRISDEYWRLVDSLEKPAYDPQAVLSMLLLGHVSSPHTLLAGIETFGPAAVHAFQLMDPITHSRETYWQPAFHPQPVADYDRLRADTAALLQRVFNRYAGAIREHGWTAAIPLSGGLDSRLATALLYEGGAPLQAFSYGPTGNSEATSAAQVARALAIPYREFAIDDPALLSAGLIQTMTERVGMLARFTTGLGGQLSLAGCAYDPNLVFITGHPANLPTGHATQPGATLIRTRQQMARFDFNNHGIPIPDGTARLLAPGLWKEDAELHLFDEGFPFSPADPIGSEEFWQASGHCSGLILQEMLTYARYGNWLLPYMDYELYDFFNTVPLQYRYGRRLHIDAILTHLFINDMKMLREIPLAGNLPLQLPVISRKERLFLALKPSLLGDAILWRQARARQQVWKHGQKEVADHPWGPDPIDYWWHARPDFRQSILDTFARWDGLGGLINTRALLETLGQPMHPLFIRFGIATLLTLQAFQQMVENRRAA